MVKLVVDNTNPAKEVLGALEQLNAEHVVGYAVHDFQSALDHVRNVARMYPEIMALNMSAMSEIFRQCADLYSELARKM